MKSILTVKHANGEQESICPDCKQKMLYRDLGIAQSVEGMQDYGGFWECQNMKCGYTTEEEEDSTYIKELKDMSPVEFEKLYMGNWKMNRSEMIQRRQELINMIEHRSGLENKTRFEDYPELNDELIKIDAVLYPEEEE